MATRYVITTERLHIRRGILSKATQETRIQRVQNVNTQQSFFERILQVGTVDFDTAGTDDSEFRFVGVANPDGGRRAVDRAQRQPARRSRDAGPAARARRGSRRRSDEPVADLVLDALALAGQRGRPARRPRCAAAISRSRRFFSSCSRSSSSAAGSAARSPARITSSATSRARSSAPAGSACPGCSRCSAR